MALCSHIRVPKENEIDHLAEVEKVFAPKQAKKRTSKKKTVKEPRPLKSNTAKKKATVRNQANALIELVLTFRRRICPRKRA